jgi:hypothetical protein
MLVRDARLVRDKLVRFLSGRPHSRNNLGLRLMHRYHDPRLSYP